jgi:hypothetical protein
LSSDLYMVAIVIVSGLRPYLRESAPFLAKSTRLVMRTCRAERKMGVGSHTRAAVTAQAA